MKNNKTEGHLFYMENFRAIAIILVVLSHLTAWGVISQSLSDFSKFNFGNATAVFVFISGFLFKYLSDRKGYSYLSYLKNKWKNVLVPYFFFAALTVIIAIVFERHQLYGLSGNMFSIWSFFVGGAIVGPLWFIPMICVFFLVSPILLNISKSRFFCFFVFLLMVVSIFTSRPFFSLNPVLSFLHFSGFFMLGMFLSVEHVRNSILFDARYSWLMIFLSCIGYFITYGWYSDNQPSEDMGFYSSIGVVNYEQLSKLMLIMIVFCFFKTFLNKRVAVLSFVARISFGLFFIHGFFLLAFYYIFTRIKIDNVFFYFALEFVFAFVLSVVVIVFVKKVLGEKWSRYVIGC